MTFPGQKRSGHCGVCPSYISIRLLQDALSGAALETSTGAECLAARVLSGMDRWDHVTPVLAHVHWLPVCFVGTIQITGFELYSPVWF